VRNDIYGFEPETLHAQARIPELIRCTCQECRRQGVIAWAALAVSHRIATCSLVAAAVALGAYFSLFWLVRLAMNALLGSQQLVGGTEELVASGFPALCRQYRYPDFRSGRRFPCQRCEVELTFLDPFLIFSATRQESPTGRAYRLQRFSNSGTYRCTHRKMDVGDAALGHHLNEIAGAELKRQIPPDAQDDDFLVKVR
jgi:hypothetical protein